MCGQTYHIKLAIADGGSTDFQDMTYDSGVFLQAGSFTSGAIELSSDFDTTSGDSIIYEGCGGAKLAFTRR